MTVDPVLDENGETLMSDVNFGKNKYFPSGPTCHFRGKEIPYLPLSSPCGGITGALLVEILSWLDSHDIYEREENGPEPFLIVDGHGSRLDPDFVEYISNKKHVRHVNLGVPHATSYWQVGDSAEQNGRFKSVLAQAKADLVNFKIKHNIPLQLTNEDIIPLLNKAWYPSFANLRTNRKAIAERGWCPLNMNLLLHKEIAVQNNNLVSEETNKTTINQEHDEMVNNLPMQLNMEEGYSGICFQRLMQYCLRNGGIERNLNNLQSGEDILTSFKKVKRLSSAVMVRRRIHEVNQPEVLELIRSNIKKTVDDENSKKKSYRNEIKKRIQQVNALRLTKPDVNDWNMKECGSYLQYKKQNGDVAMPKNISEMRDRCRYVSGRSSPDCSVHGSDDERSQSSNNNDFEEREFDVLANCSAFAEL